MRIRVVAAGAAMVLASVVGAPSAGAQTSWSMPDLRGETLASAQATYTEATNGAGPSPSLVNRFNNGEVLNFTNWIVCAQSPGPGSTITKKSKPALAINRPNQC